MTGPREEPQAVLAAICLLVVLVAVVLDVAKGLA